MAVKREHGQAGKKLLFSPSEGEEITLYQRFDVFGGEAAAVLLYRASGPIEMFGLDPMAGRGEGGSQGAFSIQISQVARMVKVKMSDDDVGDIFRC